MIYLAEFLWSFFLVATVIGSGIMGDRLSDDVAVSLLGNTIATGAILFVLIKMFGKISGAHFNPAVSIVFLLRKEIKRTKFLFYILFQFLGGMKGDFPVSETAAKEVLALPVYPGMTTGMQERVVEQIKVFHHS